MVIIKRIIEVKTIGLVLGPVLALSFYGLFDLDPAHPTVDRMAAVAILMTVWWITEAIPLAATALLPLALFAPLGIMQGSLVAPCYINSTVFLFLGGFLIALAMERWRLHRRIALLIVSRFGKSPRFLVLGFMSACAFLSMWISNTATAVMMLPIALALIVRLEEDFGPEPARPLAMALLLGIAYSCSVGGMATLIGTPPNLILSRIFAQEFPAAPSIGFAQWMLMGTPLAIVMLLIIWLILTRVFFRFDASLVVDRDIVAAERSRLGRMSYEEIVVLIVFAVTALLWFSREDLQFGETFRAPGWARLFPFGKLIDDGTVAVFMALLLFLIPARSRPTAAPSDARATDARDSDSDARATDARDSDSGAHAPDVRDSAPDARDSAPGGILDGAVFRALPWSIILLFGGGFALADGFKSSGLSHFLALRFAGLKGLDPILIVLVISLTVNFMTELTSNTASTQLILPVLASISQAMEVHPLLLMLPATLSVSMAFMLPVATPPNAIVFGSERLRIADMARVGFVINLIGSLLVTGLMFLAATTIFNFSPGDFPAWAR